MINQTNGNRGLRPESKFSDHFIPYFPLTLCAVEYAENITEHLGNNLYQVKDFNICSTNTLLRMQKEIST